MEIVLNRDEAVEIRCVYRADSIMADAMVDVMKNYLLLEKPDG